MHKLEKKMNLNKIKLAVTGCLMSLCMVFSATALEISDLENPKITEAFVDGLVFPLMKKP